MKRVLVLAIGMLLVPQMAFAQAELGVDFFGLTYNSVDGEDDAAIGIGIPQPSVRVGFAGSPRILVETRLALVWEKQGDGSSRAIVLLPGVNFLVNEQVYVRGNVGLANFSFDAGVVESSGTQYILGGALGSRRPLGSGALVRFEAGVDYGLENVDDGIPSELNVHGMVGISAIIGG